MSHLAIIWHSRTGAARALSQALEEGARDAGEGAGVRRIRARDVTADDILEAGAYVFVCPENLASMTGEMKEMFDQAYYPVLGRIEGRGYATVIAAGSDGHGAQAQIERIAMGWRLKRVADGMIVNLGAQTPEEILAPKIVPQASLSACREMGEALATGLAMGVF
ncbi:flavodoxin family protein [Novosphingobium mangrovi (ex Hu et al. 2023)]|uniref:Flavodoxin family protein n=1 Tax=Novosphingobium mangrovi (ex Hu et al. 2023) TaxID=2930094 RepID=A0ABT0A980_9SPHN|nr:NAD(P)H-dependent oxidoreductase [Novosphingobium mangrovi (ex Hu et al. 2023)]MCJ1959748.1 flavodoxin family protein [Novosphingobium mangrovi (ex Hu et al. 2023)]